MEDLAALYMTNGAYDAAIGPLARALELDPHRRSLWVALDVAVIKSGRKMVTDAELSRRAAAFKSALTS
jgi:cytochrome c-type biogenesis protein CcmH/NrfG